MSPQWMQFSYLQRDKHSSSIWISLVLALQFYGKISQTLADYRGLGNRHLSNDRPIYSISLPLLLCSLLHRNLPHTSRPIYELAFLIISSATEELPKTKVTIEKNYKKHQKLWISLFSLFSLFSPFSPFSLWPHLRALIVRQALICPHYVQRQQQPR